MDNGPIIDAHLDLAWNALSWNRDLTAELSQIRRDEAGMTDDDARGNGAVCLPELRRANVAVCLGTILSRAKADVRPATGFRRIELDVATQDIAYAVGQGQLAYYRRLAARGELRLIRNADELRDHWSHWPNDGTAPLGMILAMEGADPIAEPAQAESWWDAGLRVVGLAHYGRSHYAVGTGDEGPLTPKGRELLREFERLGMIVDLTHCSEPGFSEVFDAFAGPVMASHNNCRALVPGDRQFSDAQIRRLIGRDAVIGVALDAWMLRPGYVIGQTPRDDVPLHNVLDHIDHVCQIAGNVGHVAIGSDLDGGFGTEQCPAGLDTIADLHKLGPLLRERGYKEPDVDAIFHGNWLRFFSRNLPGPNSEGDS